jgi:hypothetical protein
MTIDGRPPVGRSRRAEGCQVPGHRGPPGPPPDHRRAACRRPVFRGRLGARHGTQLIGSRLAGLGRPCWPGGGIQGCIREPRGAVTGRLGGGRLGGGRLGTGAGTGWAMAVGRHDRIRSRSVHGLKRPASAAGTRPDLGGHRPGDGLGGRSGGRLVPGRHVAGHDIADQYRARRGRSPARCRAGRGGAGRRDAIRCSSIRRSAIQCSAVRRSAVRCSAVRLSRARHGHPGQGRGRRPIQAPAPDRGRRSPAAVRERRGVPPAGEPGEVPGGWPASRSRSRATRAAGSPSPFRNCATPIGLTCPAPRVFCSISSRVRATNARRSSGLSRPRAATDTRLR